MCVLYTCLFQFISNKSLNYNILVVFCLPFPSCDIIIIFIVPLLYEGLVANDEESYRYLVESIRRFPNQESLLAMITQAGFKSVSYRNFTFGVVAVHSGFKL